MTAYEINNGLITKKSVPSGFSNDERQIIDAVLERALLISGFKGSAKIIKGSKSNAEDDVAATCTWPGLNFFQPTIHLYEFAFAMSIDASSDYLGVTLSHELVHCRQGMWRVFWENLWWTVSRADGYPPIEEEAYDTVNAWYDKDSQKERQ